MTISASRAALLVLLPALPLVWALGGGAGDAPDADACRPGEPVRRSETLRADDGAGLYLLTRGARCGAPAMLWLHGGPGGAERPLFRLHDRGLEDDLVVAYWDQRGAGRSFDADADPARLTVARHLRDLDLVVDHLRARLRRDRIILVGHSWGSALGLLYARDHPEKVAAFVGVAQFVAGLDDQRGQYDFAVAEARARLAEIGAPPYSAADELRIQDLVDRFGGYFHTRPSFTGAVLEGVARGYVTPWEIATIIRANNVSLEAMNLEILALDLRREVPAVDTPVVFMLGRHDHQLDANLAAAYFQALRAPRKALVWLENSAHNVPFEQPDAFQAALLNQLQAIGGDAAAPAEPWTPAPGLDSRRRRWFRERRARAAQSRPRESAMSADPLLEPFQLKHLTLRNRLMTTSHEPAYSEDGMPKARYRLYHAERAKGGVALTMTAGSALVSRDSPPAFGNLHAYDDAITPWLRELADACHDHGAKVMIQLTHLGRRTGWNRGDWLPVLAPSRVREPAHRAFPKEIEDWDIERVVADYADAAERVKTAGLDGLELEAYGHLIDQFWSPATNRRQDDYNGSLDNRLRFCRRVLDAIRARIGPDFIVGMRMVADEDWDKGLSREDGLEIARRLVATGQVDFLNIIRGHIDSDAALTNVIPVQGMRSAPHLDFAGEVRAATKFPVFHAARINDVATARHAVAAGKLDMVGMTRAHIAEPHIARKIVAGREHEIRPCVGATYCLDRIYEGGEALCIHNAATGREATMPHEIAPAHTKRRVVIIGAGPAGLEAARVAGERGHDVLVLEAASQAGGQVRLAARSPRRRELIGVIDWRLERCAASGVEIRYDCFAEAETVLAEKPDVVLVCSGGAPDAGALEDGNEHVLSSWDILSGEAKPGAEVLLFDDHGSHAAMQAAELVASAGAKLEIVTPERYFAPEIGGLNLTPYMRALQPLDVTFTICRRLLSVRREGNRLRAVIGSDYVTERMERVVDQVIVEHGVIPLDELYFALKPLSSNLGAVDYAALIAGRRQTVATNPTGGFQLFRLGDAVSCRNLHAAIYDALRLVKDL